MTNRVPRIFELSPSIENNIRGSNLIVFEFIIIKNVHFMVIN